MNLSTINSQLSGPLAAAVSAPGLKPAASAAAIGAASSAPVTGHHFLYDCVVALAVGFACLLWTFIIRQILQAIAEEEALRHGRHFPKPQPKPSTKHTAKK